jgi:fluoride exporter
MTVMAVILGSALGGMARFWLADLVGRHVGERFPWGILVVNGSGAFTIGILAAVTPAAASGAGSLAWHLAVLGFLGSYTTVSSFSLQTLALAHAGAWRRAGANVAGSLGLCLSAASIGLFSGAWLTGALA